MEADTSCRVPTMGLKGYSCGSGSNKERADGSNSILKIDGASRCKNCLSASSINILERLSGSVSFAALSSTSLGYLTVMASVLVGLSSMLAMGG